MRSRKLLIPAILAVAFSMLHAADQPAAGKPVFTGQITDSICARAGSHDEAMHMSKDMGKTAAECTIACVEHMGAKYVLYDPAGKKTYRLSDQAAAKKFAGQRVKVEGTLNKKEIEVDSINAG